jgi:hypothetical protein
MARVPPQRPLAATHPQHGLGSPRTLPTTTRARPSLASPRMPPTTACAQPGSRPHDLSVPRVTLLYPPFLQPLIGCVLQPPSLPWMTPTSARAQPEHRPLPTPGPGPDTIVSAYKWLLFLTKTHQVAMVVPAFNDLEKDFLHE